MNVRVRMKQLIAATGAEGNFFDNRSTNFETTHFSLRSVAPWYKRNSVSNFETMSNHSSDGILRPPLLRLGSHVRLCATINRWTSHLT